MGLTLGVVLKVEERIVLVLALNLALGGWFLVVFKVEEGIILVLALGLALGGRFLVIFEVEERIILVLPPYNQSKLEGG